jgi:SulP family sulfate permease
VSLAALLILRRFAPKVPGSLVVVIAGIILAKAVDLSAHGVELVGHIPSGLPHYGFPHVPAHSYLNLGGSAVGIVLVGFAEGLGAAKTYAVRDSYEIDANRELIGMGAANVAAGLSAGMVVNGSLSKTAVNGGSGAKSQVSGLVVAVLTIVTLLLLTGLFEDLPETTLAAVVIAAVIELIDVAALQRLYRLVTGPLKEIYGPAARADFMAAVAAALGVTVFDTLPGLFIGIGLSVLLLVYRASRPHIAELGLDPLHPDRYVDRSRDPAATAPDGIVVLRIESSVFFANADGVEALVRVAGSRPGTRAVVLDAETMPSLDVTAADMLSRLADRLESQRVQLVVAREIGQVRDLLSVAEPGRRAIPVYPTVRAAVDAFSDEGRSEP